jgi:hypothetical protein
MWLEVKLSFVPKDKLMSYICFGRNREIGGMKKRERKRRAISVRE